MRKIAGVALSLKSGLRLPGPIFFGKFSGPRRVGCAGVAGKQSKAKGKPEPFTEPRLFLSLGLLERRHGPSRARVQGRDVAHEKNVLKIEKVTNTGVKICPLL